MRIALILLGGKPEQHRQFISEQRLESFQTGPHEATLHEAMRRGQFKVIHSLGKTRGEISENIQTLRRLHDEYRYTYYVVDFLPHSHNNRQLVHALESREAKHFKPEDWAGKLILDDLERRHVPVMNFNRYKKIVHIGDIHGHAGRLERLFRFDPKTGQAKTDPNVAYVFHGDYFNKGPDNVRVFLLLESLMRHSNVHFIWGNHENALHRYTRSAPDTRIPEFNDETRPQFRAAGILPARAEKFMRRLQDVLIYQKDGVNVVCSHAGLYHNPIGRYLSIPAQEFRKGRDQERRHIPKQESAGLKSFRESSFGENWIQVHGHSNPGYRPIIDPVFPFDINLNGNPESGGHIRLWEFERHGKTTPRFLPSETQRRERLRVIFEALERDCGVAQPLAFPPSNPPGFALA